MRRMSAVAVIALLIASTSAHAAPRSSVRRVSVPYSEPAYGSAGVGVCLEGASCAFFGPPRRGETHLAVGIQDSLGLPFVYASIIQDTNGDGNFLAVDDYTVHICGKTLDPIKLQRGKPVSIWVWQGPGVASGLSPVCPGVATSGTIEAYFLRSDK